MDVQSDEFWKAVQQALATAGYYLPPLVVDGIPGNGTRAALKKFQRNRGLQDVFPPDNRTLNSLRVSARPPALYTPPWGIIVNAKMGLHEQRDKAALEAFLRSDGSTIGDPSVFPWCGDMAETVTLNSDFGPVPSNPYLARNWAKWGKPADPGYFVYAVYQRPGPKGNEGHIGWIVGINQDGTRHRVRGGNEQNQIGDVWIPADRLVAFRLPASYAGPISPLPVLDSSAQPVSTNEA